MIEQPKHPRIKSAATIRAYAESHHECEVCGSSSHVGINRGGVRHIIPRSRGGGDVKDNLITLCGSCHTAAHRGEISAEELRGCK